MSDLSQGSAVIMAAHGVIESLYQGKQRQPVTWHIPLDVFQFLLSVANDADPKKTVQDLLNERIASPAFALCPIDLRLALRDIAQAEDTSPDTLVASWIRDRIDYEIKMKAEDL